MTSNVDHPPYYNQGGIECLDALAMCMTVDEFRGFLRGNTIKYLWRYADKGGREDLLKAQWYLSRLLEVVK